MDVRENDLWAWLVSFVLTFGVHVGIVLFASLAVALSIYALTGSLGDMVVVLLGFLGALIVVSLTVLGVLVNVQVRWFRPHQIRGVGRVVVATSGVGAGELAADVCAGLVGVVQGIPALVALIMGKPVSRWTLLPNLMSGGLFFAIGCGALALRLRLRSRGDKHAGEEQ